MPPPSSSDATVTKLEIDHKLQLEEENVKWLQDRMKQSSELTTGRLNLFKLVMTKYEHLYVL